MDTSRQLISDMENAAAKLGLKPSTLGERCGQGGHFYKGLLRGRRVWPETAEAVRKRIEELIEARAQNEEGTA